MAEHNPNSLSGVSGEQNVKRVQEKMGHHEKSKSHHKETHGTGDDIDGNTPIDDVKGPGLFQRVKEEIEAVNHHGKSKSHHHTPIDDVKGPGFFERVKEEIEAVLEAVTPKRSSKKT